MFRSLPDVEQAATRAAMPEPVPLSVLSLDMDVPDGGWASYLHERNIPVGEDDLGRPAIARVDARQLLVEQRKSEAERAQHLAAAEKAAVEADRVKFAQIWKGAAATELPDGVSAGDDARGCPRCAAEAAEPVAGGVVEFAGNGLSRLHP